MLNYNLLKEKQADYSDGIDPLFDEAVRLTLELNKASSSLLQRRLNLGYARAARLLDQLEQAGVIGVANGSYPREILIKNANEAWLHKPQPQVTRKDDEEMQKNGLSWIKTKLAIDKNDELEISLGVDEKGKKVDFNLTKYGNLTIIGSQFTALTDLLNNILATSMAKYSPDELKIIAIDGNGGDLIIPNGASHLLTPLIVEPEKSLSALKWSSMEINHRIKKERSKNYKILILINGYNQVMGFSPSETEDSLYWLLSVGRKYGIYLVIGTDYISPKTLKMITANSPAKLVFKPTDKKIARDTGIPESAELSSPSEAILETMYDGKTKITVEKIDHKKIYEEIFE